MVKAKKAVTVAISIIFILTLTSCHNTDNTGRQAIELLFGQNFEDKKQLYNTVINDENLMDQVIQNNDTDWSDNEISDLIKCEYIFSFLFTGDYENFEYNFLDFYKNKKFDIDIFYGVYIAHAIYKSDYTFSEKDYDEILFCLEEMYKFELARFETEKTALSPLVTTINTQRVIYDYLGDTQRVKELNETRENILAIYKDKYYGKEQ